MLLTKPRSDFKIWVEINPTTLIKAGKISSAGIRIHLKRDRLGLLLGSFYIPTGIFAVLAMASYVINPDAVSHFNIIHYYMDSFLSKNFNLESMSRNFKKLSSETSRTTFLMFDQD